MKTFRGNISTRVQTSPWIILGSTLILLIVVIEFVASKKGEFTSKCTKFCGLGHFGMKAKLVVV